MNIPVDKWPEVERWLLAVMEFREDARDAFLDEFCPPGMRAVISRLAHGLENTHSTEGTLLDETRIQEDIATIASDVQEQHVERTPFEQTPQHIGSYRIVSELGHGGMGVVYLCERDRPGQRTPDRAAIKILRADLVQEDAILRFRRERVLLAAINSPHVPKLLDAGTAPDGRPYFVMELVEGEPISEYVARQNPSIQGRLDLFHRACEAVAAVHDHMIVHRDIKPSNLFVRDVAGKPSVVILDFGVATVTQAHIRNDSPSLFTLTRDNTSPFTPAFAAPEQSTGAPASTEIDIHALGVLLCFLITDDPHSPFPFCSRTHSCTIGGVCATAAHQDPRSRYRTVGQLREALQAHCSRV